MSQLNKTKQILTRNMTRLDTDLSTDDITSDSGSLTTDSTSVATPQEVFNSLRIPDAIRFLPVYEGNPKALKEFIANVEEILIIIKGTEMTSYGKMLLRAIRNKIEGKANEALLSSGTALVWHDIKQNLINTFSDKRDESTLLYELHSLSLQNLSVTKLFETITEIKTSLFNQVENQDLPSAVATAKKEAFNQICLNTFVAGIKGPLGSFIRSAKPTSLIDAYESAIKERNIYYQEQSRKRKFENTGSGMASTYKRNDQWRPIENKSDNQQQSYSYSNRNNHNQSLRNNRYGNNNRDGNSRFKHNNNFNSDQRLAIMPKPEQANQQNRLQGNLFNIETPSVPENFRQEASDREKQ